MSQINVPLSDLIFSLIALAVGAMNFGWWQKSFEDGAFLFLTVMAIVCVKILP